MEVLFLSRYYHIATMGCQMNEYDSDHVGRLLQAEDFKPSEDSSRADLILINTCTVRDKAEQKAYSFLGRMMGLKKRRPHLLIGVMGCIAQQKGSALFERFPGLDFVIGTKEIETVPRILEKLAREGGRVVAADLTKPSVFPDTSPDYFKNRVKSFVTVMEGCNNFCSYCIVPYVRGREVSRLPEEIIKETRKLVEQGVKEVTLLGQNVNSYRSDESRAEGFSSLLRKLNNIEGLSRIRFTTSHPKDLSDDLIHCFKDLDKLCPHIHLPLQSGSNHVLKSMKRGYSREHYLDLVEKLRQVDPDVAITSDMIVGFPGETERNFEMTLGVVKKIEFDNIYSFKYSDREGTLASAMEPKVPFQERAARLQTLQQLQKGITLNKNRKLVGQRVEVLVEGRSKKGNELTGRTGSNKVVNFDCESESLGDLVQVKIKNAYANSLKGEFIH
jgi:tRNA-2-methylthio-N6-dimethylallyladenosine synthase